MGGQKTIGVIHSEAFRFLKTNYKQMWVIALILYGVEMALGIVMSFFLVPLQLVFSFTPGLLFRTGGAQGDFFSTAGPMLAIAGVFGAFTFIMAIVASIVQYASHIGGYDAVIRMLRGDQPTAEAVSGNFKRNWKRFVGVVAWSMLWQLLWSLLLVVPGIVKSYSYKMAPFLVLQYPDMTVRQALRKSIEMANGYKGRLFGLDLILLLYAFATVLGTAVLFVGALAVQIMLYTPMMLLLYTFAYMDIRQAAVDRGLLQD